MGNETFYGDGLSVDKTNRAIHWMVIYPLDSVIHLSNNQGLEYILKRAVSNATRYRISLVRCCKR